MELHYPSQKRFVLFLFVAAEGLQKVLSFPILTFFLNETVESGGLLFFLFVSRVDLALQMPLILLDCPDQGLQVDFF